MRVQVVQGVHKLLGDLAHFRLAQVPVVLEDLEELALGKLGNDAELVARFERVEQQNNVFVVESFQNFNFLPEVVHLLLGFASSSNDCNSR